MMNLKHLAAAVFLAAASAYGAGRTDWLQTGLDVAKQVGGKEVLQNISPDWGRLADSLLNSQKSDGSKRRQSANAYTGRVSKVSDGDTLHVTDGNGRKHKIRLAYIDVPELQQLYGTRSRDSLRAAAEGETVQVRVFEHDRYKREVARVSKDGTDLNLMQLRNGAAWHYGSYAKKQQEKSAYAAYAAAQRQARQAREGLWRANNPQAPWDYRKAQREAQGGQNRQGNVWDLFGLW
ncbi:thermonuclease family protein [Neisseria chenwenguii]|nr:thermonuclease family protein [Neisseria chenwenguii]